MVRALHGRWREPLLPHLYRFQPPGFLSVPWREDWRLPGTQGPTRSLRPPLLGASGLSLGINSLDLEGWGREGEAPLRCLQKQETTKPIPETASAPRHLEWRFRSHRGSSVPTLGPAELSAETPSLPGWGSWASSSAVSESLACLTGSQVTPEARFPFKINNGLFIISVLGA